MECSICASNFTSQIRKQVKCINNECESNYCLECFKNYLLKSEDYNQSCPLCSTPFTLKDVFAQCNTKDFIDEIMKKITIISLNNQKNMLPQSQPEAKIILIERDFDKWRKKETEKILALYREIRKVEDHINSERIRRCGADVLDKLKKEKNHYTFIKQCSWQGCKGMLSKAWKCPLCEKFTCSKCHEPKENDEHVCNEDTVKNIETLKRESKPCPKCGTAISKLDGCFAGDTKIMLWDGSTKLAKDITIGDELVGDDGSKRTVLETKTGNDIIYEIIQNKGENYKVNSKHKLALKYCSHKKIEWCKHIKAWKIKWFDKKIHSKNFKVTDIKNKIIVLKEAIDFKDKLDVPDIIEITVEEYIKLPKTTKKSLLGFKSNGVFWKYQEIHLDPYILGSWLGDGYSNGKEFCSNDKEIIDYWNFWSKENDAEIIKTANKFRYYVRRNKNSLLKSNPLKDKLKLYNLVNNKHIPKEYLINDRKTRLKLLAGIIDTDGHVCNNGRRIQIRQSNEKLSEQIIFLARSLGFSVSIYHQERKNDTSFSQEPKNYKNQQVVNISGYNINEIPTLVIRKKCSIQKGGVDLLRTNIKIKVLKDDKYYGWMLDKNKRFLLHDFTVLRNCDQMYCVSCHTAFSWRTGQIENGYIHNPEYFRYRRDNDLEIARNPNEGRGFEIDECFDPLEHQYRRQVEVYFLNRLRRYSQKFDLKRNSNLLGTLRNVFRYAIHTKIIILDKYDINLDTNLEKLRVSYLVGDIDEEKWTYEIKKKTKEYHRNNAQYEIINTFLKIWGDIIMNIIYILEQGKDVKNNIINQINIFVKYLENTNKELKNIRGIFKSKERSYFQIVRRENSELLNHPHEISFYINVMWDII